jgi:hypothetical protein
MRQPLVLPPGPGDYFMDPLLVSIRVGSYQVRHVFIYTGSFSDIIYEQCFRRMDMVDQQRLVYFDDSIVGFTGESIKPPGKIRFPVIIGERERTRAITLTFLVISADSLYNIILGRPTLGVLQAAVSSLQRMVS